jgi:phytoene desaturase
MSYADMAFGTWYPRGGMYKIIEALTSLAGPLGVQFEYNCSVQSLTLNATHLKGCVVHDRFQPFDYVVAGADSLHVEQQLLPASHRTYSHAYWSQRVMAPLSLIFYVGINKKLKNLLHHTLFFDEDFTRHADEIYVNPQWPSSPPFYVSTSSKTNSTVAPQGGENTFILIPVASGLQDEESIREKYFDLVLSRLETFTNENIRYHIVFKRNYAHHDLITDYHAFKGNACALANALWQTANLRPSIASKKLRNLFFHRTINGAWTGVPALISGELVSEQLMKRHKKLKKI